MNPIQETLNGLAKREEELAALMLSATEQFSQREQAMQAAIDSLATRVNTVQAEQEANSKQAVEKAVSISNQYTEYQNLISQVRLAVSRALPQDATVIIVSRGDNELLKLEGRNAWHFPQNEWGVYAGYYPADSAEAIAHLEALRKKGGQYVVFPQTAFWWLEHYREFKQHLDKVYQMVVGPNEACVIYHLGKRITRTAAAKPPFKSRTKQRRASGARVPVKLRPKAKA